MDNYQTDTWNNGAASENSMQTDEQKIEMDIRSTAEIAQHFSGLRPDGSPKAILHYCAYDFGAPDDDIDKQTISVARPARAELSLDRLTGFYTLDLVFPDENDLSLKLLWQKLQKHRSNETYRSDTTWIFYIKMFENLTDEELEFSNTVYTADILNPLAYFLVRTVPDQKVQDYPVEPGIYSGGNTIRMLLHRDLVTFQYETLENDISEDIQDDGKSRPDIPEEETD